MRGRTRTVLTAMAASGLLLVPGTVAGQSAATHQVDAGDSSDGWTIDRSHSRVGFSVRHFFTPVEGAFTDYEIDLEFDPDAPEAGRVRVTVDAASVDTGNERRDDDLRSANFFEVETYPELSFESTAIRRVADDEFVVEGELTIRDVTRPIELTARLLGIRAFEGEMARHGRMVAGFAATGVIDRGEFGVGSGRWAETVVLGPEVTIDVLLEARRP